jgi:hypothetical protein
MTAADDDAAGEDGIGSAGCGLVRLDATTAPACAPGGGAGERMSVPSSFGVSMAWDHSYCGCGATVARTMAGCAGAGCEAAAGEGSRRPSARWEAMRCSPESASRGGVMPASQGLVSSTTGSRITARMPSMICLPKGVSALQRGMIYNIHPAAAHPPGAPHSTFEAT